MQKDAETPMRITRLVALFGHSHLTEVAQAQRSDTQSTLSPLSQILLMYALRLACLWSSLPLLSLPLVPLVLSFHEFSSHGPATAALHRLPSFYRRGFCHRLR